MYFSPEIMHFNLSGLIQSFSHDCASEFSKSEHMKLCFAILICDLAKNLITINKLRLTKVGDPSLTSRHFETVKESYI